uniref:Uncharacterized protein n=1 Tax=Rhizophora mucronata TaxID=61149 RepID=A0A2P2QG25_RHIMU
MCVLLLLWLDGNSFLELQSPNFSCVTSRMGFWQFQTEIQESQPEKKKSYALH